MNRNSNKSNIVTTVVVFLVCLVLVTGSTFSLFTSKTGTNIAVTTGNVEMVATIDASTLALYSKGAAQTGKFANGGTAAFNEAKTELTLTNITPGDKAEFEIVLENKSNIDIQYRVNWIVDGDLAEALVATVDGAEITGGASEWTPWEADAAEKTQTLKIAIELPLEADDNWESLAANIAFNVEAVQGNAGTYVELNEGDDLLAALASAEKDFPLTVKLNGNVEWPTEGHHGENDITPASSITIEGNGYTITATGSGVTPLGDTEAPMTLKNVKIVDESVSYAEGAWELTYLELGGIKLTCENVTFADEIQLGTNATFTNCSFESNEESVYAVWVEDGSATFNNCTFAGYRGLKAHEAYGSEISSVVVKDSTFNSISKKPGIALGTLNADTIVSITDSTFIDCQAGDQGLYIYETDTDVTTIKFTNENNDVIIGTAVTNAAELKTALSEGRTNIPVSGSITLTEGLNATNVTLIGLSDDAAINFAGHNIGGSGEITYKNLTLTTVSLPYAPENGERYGWHGGIDYVGHSVANYINCEISGVFTPYSETVNVKGCTFTPYIQDGEEFYHIFVYSSKTVNVEDSNFYYADRSIKIYNEGGTNEIAFNISNSNFYAADGATVNKALINVDASSLNKVTLTISNITVDEALNGVEIWSGDSNKVTASIS